MKVTRKRSQLSTQLLYGNSNHLNMKISQEISVCGHFLWGSKSYRSVDYRLQIAGIQILTRLQIYLIYKHTHHRHPICKLWKSSSALTCKFNDMSVPSRRTILHANIFLPSLPTASLWSRLDFLRNVFRKLLLSPSNTILPTSRSYLSLIRLM